MNPESFWQEILPAGSAVETGYAACFDDGRILVLPTRPLPNGQGVLASLIVNQASFTVVDALAESLTQKLRVFAPDIVVGLPTLGLTLASAVAQKLGHTRYAPLGTSAKFWYREDLSVALSSITTPHQQKRLYIDPRLLPMIQGRRVALIDDVISSGGSIMAAIALLEACGVRPIVIGTAMLQSDCWRGSLASWTVVSVLQSPILPAA